MGEETKGVKREEKERKIASVMHHEHDPGRRWQ